VKPFELALGLRVMGRGAHPRLRRQRQPHRRRYHDLHLGRTRSARRRGGAGTAGCDFSGAFPHWAL